PPPPGPPGWPAGGWGPSPRRAKSVHMRSRRGLRTGPAGRPAQDLVDRLAATVLGVRPEMGVGVEGLHCALVAEALLHHFDTLAMADEQARVVVAQVVERHLVAEPGSGRRRPPDV